MIAFIKDQKRMYDMTRAMRKAETYQALEILSDAELAKLARWVCKEFRRWSGGYNPDLKVTITFRWGGRSEDGWYAYFSAAVGTHAYAHRFRYSHQVFKELNPLSPISARFNQASIDQRNYERYLAFVCLDALRRQYGCWVDQQLHVDTYGTGLISPAEEAYRRSQD